MRQNGHLVLESGLDVAFVDPPLLDTKRLYQKTTKKEATRRKTGGRGSFDCTTEAANTILCLALVLAASRAAKLKGKKGQNPLNNKLERVQSD